MAMRSIPRPEPQNLGGSAAGRRKYSRCRFHADAYGKPLTPEDTGEGASGLLLTDFSPGLMTFRPNVR